MGALFLNVQKARIICLILLELGHPQPSTPVHVGNTTAVGIVNNTIKQQRSRAMEIRYFWFLNQKNNRYFKVYYKPGAENMRDYSSKAHTGAIHTHGRPYYMHMGNSPRILLRAHKPSLQQGYDETLWSLYYKRVPVPTTPSNHKLGNSSRIAQWSVHTTVQHQVGYNEFVGTVQLAAKIRRLRSRAVLRCAKQKLPQSRTPARQ